MTPSASRAVTGMPIVRRATAHDAARLAVLRWHSRSDDERRREALPDFERRFAGWIRDALTSGAWRIVVAHEEARIVGCMYLRRVDTVPVPGMLDRAWGYVTHAYVVESHRNRGTGRRLLGSLVDDAIAMGLVELHVWPSAGAISLYVRAGFRSPEAQRSGDEPDEPSYVLPLAGKLR